MTIVQFQYILAVAQYKNFSVAAEKCFVTQPTLSMQVQRLEEELDVLIFDRTKKPVRVTEVGEKILKQAECIVNESDRIKGLHRWAFPLRNYPYSSSYLTTYVLEQFYQEIP